VPKWAFDNAAEVCQAFDKLGIPVWPKESIATNDPDSWRDKWACKVPPGMPLTLPNRAGNDSIGRNLELVKLQEANKP
jgi:hypothetical protein